MTSYKTLCKVGEDCDYDDCDCSGVCYECDNVTSKCECSQDEDEYYVVRLEKPVLDDDGEISYCEHLEEEEFASIILAREKYNEYVLEPTEVLYLDLKNDEEDEWENIESRNYEPPKKKKITIYPKKKNTKKLIIKKK